MSSGSSAISTGLKHWAAPGMPLLQTPNLDSLAPAARVAVAGSPLCTPLRNALLTGQCPHK